MSKKTDDFISTIAPIAQAEFSNRDKWILPSVCIAQACLESGFNLNAKTLFGIKGNGDSLKTVEYINGKYITTTATFKKYPDIVSAVHGYYDLITTNNRYIGAVNNYNYLNTVRFICLGGYATDPNYYNKIVYIIQNYNLTKYDVKITSDIKADVTYKKATKTIAKKVIRGDYGNGDERKQKLENDGYNYEEVQKIVNDILKG